METKFKAIDPNLIEDNAFKLIGTDWMLITAGTLDNYNTMTASGGGFGMLWKRKVCFCVIKPKHYTYSFMEKAKYFTLSFFAEEYRSVLEFCGSTSGRDVDKVAAVGITPIKGASGTVYFAEARLVLECRKIYFQDIDPNHFIDPKIHERYPDKDYHRMYIGEIVRCLLK
ncbi:MAG: flavin reductase [Methanomassiliicoccales archaeon]|nr:MAG: flavin reductase [Methanomassiliicoccales archaeon]